MASRNDILRMLGTGMTARRVAAQLKIPLAEVLKADPTETPKPKKPKKPKGVLPTPPKSAVPPAEPAVPPAPKKRGPPKGVSRKDPAYIAECVQKGKTPKVGGNPKGADPEKRKATQFQKGNPGGKLKKNKHNGESITESFRRYWREHTAQEDKTAVWTGLMMRAKIGDDRAIKLMVDLNGESLEAEMKNKLIKDEGCRVVFTLPVKGDG